MSTRKLTVLVESQPDGRVAVLSPGVGFWSLLPAPGSPIGRGSVLGFLAQLGARSRLVLPDGAAGRIDDALPTSRIVPVEYRQLMFRIAPLDSGMIDSPEPSSVDLPSGAATIVSPTDGVFYRRPSTGAPAFVEVGSRIASGQPVGLVEVMKTFNQITYGGPGLPAEAEIVEIRCADAEEVHAGQVLFVLR